MSNEVGGEGNLCALFENMCKLMKENDVLSSTEKLSLLMPLGMSLGVNREGNDKFTFAIRSKTTEAEFPSFKGMGYWTSCGDSFLYIEPYHGRWEVTYKNGVRGEYTHHRSFFHQLGEYTTELAYERREKGKIKK